jgi:hypothetical protein
VDPCVVPAGTRVSNPAGLYTVTLDQDAWHVSTTAFDVVS